MAITTRETTATGVTNKGSPLTNAEVDTNFIELQQNKIELDDLSVGAEGEASGDGSVTYDDATGVFTYTPPADISGAVTFAAQAGEALTKGDAVYVSGVSGNTPVVSKADANDASKMPAFGLAEADASLNAAVNVVTFGTLYDLDTSSFTAGDTVYISTTAGAITATAPTGESSLLQNIGKVIRSHASAGSIKVGGAGRTNATPNLNDGNVFIGNASNQAEARALVEADISDLQTYLTSVSVDGLSDATITTPADNEVLAYDSTSSEWINQTAAEAGLATSAQGTLADSALQNIVEDTTPQLGGTLDFNGNTATNFTSTGIDDNATSTAITIDSSQDVTFTSDAKFPDTGKALFGAGPDLEIRHDATNSVIDNYTGNLILRNYANDQDITLQSDNGTGGLTAYFRADGSTGRSILYHYGSQKIQTTSGGVEVTGDIDVDGVMRSTGEIRSGTHVVAGRQALGATGGEVALTINDSKGNANVTFNHTSGVPDQNGNSARIVVNTDTTSNASMLFQLASGVTGGTSVNTTQIFRIDEQGVEVTGETHTDTLDVRKDVASTVIATMENADVTASHVLKLTAGGAGTGTKILECIGGAGDVVEIRGNGDITTDGDLTDVGGITSRGTLRGTTTTGAGTPTFSFDGDTNTGMYHVSADHLGFATGGTTRCIIDSVGNIGFGTDPITNGSYKVVEIKSTHTDAGGYIRLQGTNSTTRASIFNFASTMYLESQGGSFSFRDNSGNVRAIINTNSISSQGASNPYVRAMSSSDNNYVAALKVNFAEEAFNLTGGKDYKILACDGFAQPNGIKFYASNDEKMRLDDSGNLMIGKTVMAAQANGLAVLGESTNAATASLNVSTKNNTNNTTNILVNFRRGGTETTSGTASGAIAVNGTSQAAFIAYSDERLKENIEDLPSQIESIKSLRPCEFDYKDGSGHQIGFIAQEMQQVYSDCVGEDDDGFLTIGGWNKTEARLVKAIQEQQAMIEALTQRIEQLEAN